MKFNQENLYQKYVIEKMSIKACAKYFKVSHTTVNKYLHEFNIPTRSKGRPTMVELAEREEVQNDC